MPRGFLVKRSRRCSVSYRARAPARGSDQLPVFHRNERNRHAQTPDTDEQVTGAGVPVSAGELPRLFPPPASRHIPGACSPVRVPVGTSLPGQLEEQQPFTGRCLTSSPLTELPELQVSVSSRLHTRASGPSDRWDATGAHVHLFPPPINPQQLPIARKRSCAEPEPRVNGAPEKPQKAEKPKGKRRVNLEDEVTRSPVLGLRIKKESPELRRNRDRSGPLGEFICQLCREEYTDPVSLAQHRCSRIVRVEYRCPECDKVFSCPANLASHRRWHKPRPVPGPEEGGATEAHERLPVDGKENEHRCARDTSRRRLQPQGRARDGPDSGGLAPPHFGRMDAQQHATEGPPVSVRGGNPEERTGASPLAQVSLARDELPDCRHCGRTFRRAYVSKHLHAHETARASPPVSSFSPARSGGAHCQAFVCHLCGARFPSAEVRNKHRLWHVMRGELLQQETVFHTHRDEPQQIFTCTQCPSTFFSSPGLTRHMDKTHPTDNRQVVLLHELGTFSQLTNHRAAVNELP